MGESSSDETGDRRRRHQHVKPPAEALPAGAGGGEAGDEVEVEDPALVRKAPPATAAWLRPLRPVRLVKNKAAVTDWRLYLIQGETPKPRRKAYGVRCTAYSGPVANRARPVF